MPGRAGRTGRADAVAGAHRHAGANMLLAAGIGIAGAGVGAAHRVAGADHVAAA